MFRPSEAKPLTINVTLLHTMTVCQVNIRTEVTDPKERENMTARINHLIKAKNTYASTPASTPEFALFQGMKNHYYVTNSQDSLDFELIFEEDFFAAKDKNAAERLVLTLESLPDYHPVTISITKLFERREPVEPAPRVVGPLVIDVVLLQSGNTCQVNIQTKLTDPTERANATKKINDLIRAKNIYARFPMHGQGDTSRYYIGNSQDVLIFEEDFFAEKDKDAAERLLLKLASLPDHEPVPAIARKGNNGR